MVNSTKHKVGNALKGIFATIITCCGTVNPLRAEAAFLPSADTILAQDVLFTKCHSKDIIYALPQFIMTTSLGLRHRSHP